MRSLMARFNMLLKWGLGIGAFLTSMATLIIETNYSKAAIISSIAICIFVIGFVLICMYYLPNDDSHSASQVGQLDSTPQPLMISYPTVPPNPSSSSTSSPTMNREISRVLLFLESRRRGSFRQATISRRPSVFDEAPYTSYGSISHYAEVLISRLPQRFQSLVPDMEGRLLESLPITSPLATVSTGEDSITDGQLETIQQGGSSGLGLTTISGGVPHFLEHSSDKRESSYQAIGSSSKAVEEATVSHLPAVGRVNREPCVDAVDPHPSNDSTNDPQPSNDDPQPSYVASNDPMPSRDATNTPLLGGEEFSFGDF